MSIDELKLQESKLIEKLHNQVTDLQFRLTKLGITIWWSNSTYRIGYRFSGKSIAFYLTDEKLKRLMTLSNEEFNHTIESLVKS